MLKTNIYASGVNNLSDARYFAAMGVEYIGFPIDESLDIAKISEIINWVEGPTYIGEVGGLHVPSNFDHILKQENFSKYKVGPFFKDFELINLPIIKNYVWPEIDQSIGHSILTIEQPFSALNTNDRDTIRKLISTEEVWLDIPFVPQELIELIDTFSPHGIIVKGGEEERPGVKSFDELDEIFEALEG